MPTNSERVTVPMSENMKTWVADQATAERRTMAEIVRYCVQKEMTWQEIARERKNFTKELKELLDKDKPEKGSEFILSELF